MPVLRQALAGMNPDDVRLLNAYLVKAFACYDDHIKGLEQECMRLGKLVYAGSEQRREELDTKALELSKAARHGTTCGEMHWACGPSTASKPAT